MTCTLLTPDPAEYKTRLNLQQIVSTSVDMHMHPKIFDLPIDPECIYNKHIDNTSAKSPKHILTVLSSTKMCKHTKL